MLSDLFVSYETFGEFFRTMEFVELLLLVLCAVVSAGALDLDNGVHLVMIPKSYRLQSFQFDRRIDVGMNGTFREKPLMREISDAINASLDSLNEICDSRAISRREKRSLWGLLGLSTKSEVDVVAQKVAILRAHEDTYRQQMNSIRESAQTLFKQIGDDEAIIQEEILALKGFLYELTRSYHMSLHVQVMHELDKFLLTGHTTSEYLGASITSHVRLQKVVCSKDALLVYTQRYSYAPTRVKIQDASMLFQGGFAPLPKKGYLLDPEIVFRKAPDTPCPPSLFYLSESEKDKVMSREGVLEGGRLTDDCYLLDLPEKGAPTHHNYGGSDLEAEIAELETKYKLPPLHAHMPDMHPPAACPDGRDWEVRVHEGTSYLALILAFFCTMDLIYRRARGLAGAQ